LQADTAAVQADDAQNSIRQEAVYEGDDAAPEEDTQRALQLAEELKSTDLLPPGWVEKTDQKTGKCYYENIEAKKTTWDPPRSLVSIALAAARGQRDAQIKIKSLRMKLEEMSSSRDLGESASSSCSGEVQKALGSFKQAVSPMIANFFQSLAKDLNLTGEQQQLLQKTMGKQEAAVSKLVSSFAMDAPSSLKLAKGAVATDKHAQEPVAGKTKVYVKREELSSSEQRTLLKEAQDAKDKIAMAETDTLAQKAAQEGALREAKRLHDEDAALRKQVTDAAHKKEMELQKQDDELEKASRDEDSMTAKIMGPKATAAERHEEKVLTGELSTDLGESADLSLDDEHDELEFGAIH